LTGLSTAFGTFQGGSDAFLVEAGDVFGFRVWTLNNFSGRADLTITDFEVAEADSAAAVPEPTSMLLLGTGLVGLGARRWRQRKRE
jgi:hypothetical protein